MLDDEYWKNKIEFTYIGNIPKNIDFKNTNLIQPLSGKELADEIKKNHIYVTASINEPSGNHHIRLHSVVYQYFILIAGEYQSIVKATELVLLKKILKSS